MAVPPVHLLVQVDVDVDAAGLVVGLQVEGLGHRLRRGGEGELARVAIATHHVLADVVVQLNGVVGPYLEVLDGQLHRVVAGIDERVGPPCLALPAAVGELVANLVGVSPVGLAVAVVVPVVVPALVTVTHVLALVVGLVVPLLLPLDAIVCQSEWRGGLLAGAVEMEVVVCHMAVPPIHLLVQVDVDVDAAGVVVGLQVEGLGHRLSRGSELEGDVVVLAPDHVLTDVGGYLQAVIGSYLEILSSELHRVVALFD